MGRPGGQLHWLGHQAGRHHGEEVQLLGLLELNLPGELGRQPEPHPEAAGAEGEEQPGPTAPWQCGAGLRERIPEEQETQEVSSCQVRL